MHRLFSHLSNSFCSFNTQFKKKLVNSVLTPSITILLMLKVLCIFTSSGLQTYQEEAAT